MNKWLLRGGIALIALHVSLLFARSFGPVVLIYLIAGPHWYSAGELPKAFSAWFGEVSSYLGISAGEAAALSAMSFVACAAWVAVVVLLARRSSRALPLLLLVGGTLAVLSVAVAKIYGFQKSNLLEVAVYYALLCVIFLRRGVRDLFPSAHT